MFENQIRTSSANSIRASTLIGLHTQAGYKTAAFTHWSPCRNHLISGRHPYKCLPNECGCFHFSPQVFDIIWNDRGETVIDITRDAILRLLGRLATLQTFWVPSQCWHPRVAGKRQASLRKNSTSNPLGSRGGLPWLQKNVGPAISTNGYKGTAFNIMWLGNYLAPRPKLRVVEGYFHDIRSMPSFRAGRVKYEDRSYNLKWMQQTLYADGRRA